MNDLAYVTAEGVITLLESNGNQEVIDDSGIDCTWPTWSSDGRRIAYSGIREAQGGNLLLGVFSRDMSAKTRRLVYLNESGTSGIARKTPHYLYWSPDNQKLTFVAQTPDAGLALFLLDMDSDEAAVRLIDRGPMYFSWSHDSRYLFAHSSRMHHLVDFTKGIKPQRLPGMASAYMAPSWSPTINKVAMCQDLALNVHAIYIGDFENGGVSTLMEMKDICSFSWSAGGHSLAVLRDIDRDTGYYRGLSIVDPETGESSQITADPVLAFFWSPTEERLAYITPSESADGSVRWCILDTTTREKHYLADFTPSQEQLITFMFFDQYAQSHSPWSPDGKSLLFSGLLGHKEVRTELPLPSETSIFVANVDSETGTQEISGGTFASWRPHVVPSE